MPVSFSAVIKGIVTRFKGAPKTSDFQPLGWLEQKKLKHLDDVSLKDFKIGQLHIRYRRPYEILHTYKELFEEEIYKFISPTPSPFIIDCGANIGLSVLYFKSLFPQASITAFEPDKANFELLEINCRLNNLSGIDLRKAAVWKTNGVIKFSSDGTQGSQIAGEKDQSNVIEVKAERLADLLGRQPVDFLKIDIEGAEVDVLEDCRGVLKNVKNLFVEYHGLATESEKLSRLLNLLKEEFGVYIKMAADNLQHPFVTKNTGFAFDVQLNIFCYR